MQRMPIGVSVDTKRIWIELNFALEKFKDFCFVLAEAAFADQEK